MVNKNEMLIFGDNESIILDVIDTNDKAMKFYVKAGFEEIDRIEMFYEVVGTRKFWMLEYVFEKQIQ